MTRGHMIGADISNSSFDRKLFIFNESVRIALIDFELLQQVALRIHVFSTIRHASHITKYERARGRTEATIK